MTDVAWLDFIMDHGRAFYYSLNSDGVVQFGTAGTARSLAFN